MFKQLSLITLLILFKTAFPQELNYKQIDIKDGLPSRTIFSLLQDTKGYVWGSSNYGVFKYNGVKYKIFDVASGLPDETVFNLKEDRHGRIWGTTLNNKIFFIDNDSVYQIAANAQLSKMLRTGGRLIVDYCFDSKDTLWIGTTLTPFKIAPVDNYAKVLPLRKTQDTTETVVYVNNRNFAFWSKSYYRFPDAVRLSAPKEHYSFRIEILLANAVKNINIIKPLNERYVSQHKFLVLNDRRVLISYLNDLYIISPEGSIKTIAFKSKVTAIYQDVKGNCWLGFDGDGLYQYQNSDFKNNPKHYYKFRRIVDVIVDYEGGIWASVAGKGLEYTPSVLVKTYKDISGLEGVITSMLNINDTLYVCNDGGEIFTSCSDTTSIKKIATGLQLPKEPFNIEKEGSVFFTSGYNSAKYNSKFQMLSGFYQGGNPINFVSVAFLKNGDYWLLTPYDLLYYKAGKVAEIYKLPAKGTSIALNDQNEVYVLTVSDLYVFRNGSFMQEPLTKDLKFISNSKMTQDSLGNIFLFLSGEGILVLSKGKLMHIKQTKYFAPYNSQFERVRNNEIWTCTNKGILNVKLDYSNIENSSVSTFSNSILLPAKSLNFVSKRGDKVWIASDFGLYVVDQKERLHNANPPKTILRKITLNDNIKVSGMLDHEFSYQQNNLTFYVDVLTFKDPNEARFEYELVSNDSRMKGLGYDKIVFSNLQPEKYALTIVGLNSDGVKSIPIVVKFVVKPPFWKTIWFAILCVFCSAAIIWIYIWWRIKLFRQKEAEKSEVIRKLSDYQLLALRAQMNPHFIFNAISSIQNYILLKDRKDAYNYLTKFSELIRGVLNNASEKLISLEKELETVNIYAELEQLRFENKFDFIVNVDEEVDVTTMMIPGMLIQPFVENAIWHGIMPLENTRQGKIELVVSLKNEKLQILVRDNGIGRVKSDLISKKADRKSYGISLSRQRLNLITDVKENIRVIDLYDRDGEACGTCVEISI